VGSSTARPSMNCASCHRVPPPPDPPLPPPSLAVIFYTPHANPREEKKAELFAVNWRILLTELSACHSQRRDFSDLTRWRGHVIGRSLAHPCSKASVILVFFPRNAASTTASWIASQKVLYFFLPRLERKKLFWQFIFCPLFPSKCVMSLLLTELTQHIEGCANFLFKWENEKKKKTQSWSKRSMHHHHHHRCIHSLVPGRLLLLQTATNALLS